MVSRVAMEGFLQGAEGHRFSLCSSSQSPAPDFLFTQICSLPQHSIPLSVSLMALCEVLKRTGGKKKKTERRRFKLMCKNHTLNSCLLLRLLHLFPLRNVERAKKEPNTRLPAKSC